MFHDLPAAVAERMAFLEASDARDRRDGTPRPQRLFQISPDTGRFVALLAAGAPPGDWIELGTSGGYSTLWLALACREAGRRLTTFEVLEEKATLARETFALAGVDDVVELLHGDARDHLSALCEIGFCFLDAEKSVYLECYELVVPRLVRGGLLLADDAVVCEAQLRPMLDRALVDPRVDAMVVPVGDGVLVCRRL